MKSEIINKAEKKSSTGILGPNGGSFGRKKLKRREGKERVKNQ